jgi:hypothetical protein
MRCVQALTEYDGNGVSLFLAGGITGCPDWQSELTALLADTELTLLDPRRPNFPAHDPLAAPQQIEWEFRHLRKADAVLFWFPCETVCPITLYELGAWSMTAKPLFVGTHPDYQRRLDVQVQTRLARPEVAVLDRLADLASAVRAWALRGRSDSTRRRRKPSAGTRT